MDSQEVGKLLEECLKTAKDQQSSQPTETERLNYCSCKDILCEELASLLQDAVEMKWPFVPEKWQYKQSVLANDKTNLSDLISKHLPQLLAILKAAIVAREAHTALSVIFLVDRFLYWTDESKRLMDITKLLYKHHCGTPVAPQLVIRQARVYLNSGKLQKAEYILSSLINNKGATGCWVYHSESDQALVQAVSVQVRGMILQKLGLWLEAAELIWASLVGFYALPQPDKKGIGTSLGILASILVSMNDEDFNTFRKNPDIDLRSLLGDVSHRLLSAAQAAKMAVVYSQYTSLYVLTNVATQGTCLLSYSFSVQCPTSHRKSFLQEAREAFEIGLLTKAEGELVSSQQELHTFVKAAYSLTVTHKWLGTSQELITQSTQACHKALATFYDYSQPETHNKDGLCAEIMHLITQVKLLLQVKPFLNSDKGSFIPDSYRNITDTDVNFTLEGFAKVMQKFRKYHASLCETASLSRPETGAKIDRAKLCLTLWTTVGDPNNECHTKASSEPNDAPKGEEPQQRGSGVSSEHILPQCDTGTTQDNTDDLGSSWHKISMSSSGSPRPSNNISYTGSSAVGGATDASDQSCLTTESDGEDMSESAERNRKQEFQSCNSVTGSHPVPITSSNNSDPERYQMAQAGMETLDSKHLMTDEIGVLLKSSISEGAVQSLSQLTLKTSSSSLGDSFGSQSSWEKVSLDPNSPTSRKPQPHSLYKTRTSPVGRTSESDESIFDLETLDTESSDSALSFPDKTHKSEAWSIPRPLRSYGTDPDKGTKVDHKSFKPAAKNFSPNPTPQHSQFVQEQSDPTEGTTESSFEMLEESEDVNVPQNPFCYSCLKHTNAVVPKRQYELSLQDYQALLAGVCHGCLLKRLQSNKTEFKLKEQDVEKTHCALHLKFSKATGLWTARETCVHIGKPMGMEGKQRRAIWVQFLHQEERLSSYVGKDYLHPRAIQFHLKDVERQMTAQYYVTEFNKSLYDKEVMAQIFFIPSDALLILDGNEIVGCITVEPFMLGDFVKLTNNTKKKEMRFKATKYGLAFGHFTYLFSDCQEVVVDLQGWVTANGKGLTYLTDPQIHSTKTPKGPSNFAAGGLRVFLEVQHGPECNEICQVLKLPPVVILPHSD
ncbi:alpha-protein kinase 1 [Halichoeres trimaculatus]|uniref:alpha-protein kinase 1 n=1 Tax=Halichoeres trimaculatus TaxID=147232 RepID=UPI003D9EADDB